MSHTTDIEPAAGETSAAGRWYQDFAISTTARFWAAAARILIGWIFLWAFLDKAFGLGWTTPAEQAWKFGAGDGSPTYGFLKFGSNPDSPFSGMFSSFANTAEGNPNAWVNWAFMLGLLAIGVTLMLGVFMRLGSIAGVVMLALMYLAEWPIAQQTQEGGGNVYTNPVVDDHIVYIVVLMLLMLLQAGTTWGLGRWWQSLGFVKRMPWLA